MIQIPVPEAQNSCVRDEKRARLILVLIQMVFLAAAAFQIDGPFLSAHNERQNQTFDAARHVFREGWSAVLTPKASFSLPGYEQQPFTAIQLEFPFHGLFGWPLATLTGHERAAVRIVSILFALVSIELVYRILLQWLKHTTAVAGAALWASAPLVVQFGQVPMPDILCTAGMLAAFLLALRGNLLASSGSFLFSLLAKPNVIVFGLPILTALLLKRHTRSYRACVRDAIAWGTAPLLGLLSWILIVHYFSPPTPWTFFSFSERGSSIFTSHLWIQTAACILPFGIGILGFFGLVCGIGKAFGPDRRLRWAILVANFFYFILILNKLPEPQYYLPPLVWTVTAAASGIEFLRDKLKSDFRWRYGLIVGCALHVALALILILDLKASRVPDFSAIQNARDFLPAGARVIAVYRYYGASAAVWLDHNVLAIQDVGTLTKQLPVLKQAGFTHLCILDIESHHGTKSHSPLQLVANHVRRLLGHAPAPDAEDLAYAAPSSNIRSFCDEKFTALFQSPHVLLYSMLPPAAR